MATARTVWAEPLPAGAISYTPGDPSQFETLESQADDGIGGSGDTFDSDLAALLASLPALGAVGDTLDPILSDLSTATGAFAVDEAAAVLADIASIGPGVESSISALSLLSAFGDSPLSGLSDVINMITNGFDIVGNAFQGVYQAIQGVADWVEAAIQEILGFLGI